MITKDVRITIIFVLKFDKVAAFLTFKRVMTKIVIMIKGGY